MPRPLRLTRKSSAPSALPEQEDAPLRREPEVIWLKEPDSGDAAPAPRPNPVHQLQEQLLDPARHLREQLSRELEAALTAADAQTAAIHVRMATIFLKRYIAARDARGAGRTDSGSA